MKQIGRGARRWTRLGAVVASAALVLTACGGNGNGTEPASDGNGGETGADTGDDGGGGSAADGEPIPVGLLQPLTGPVSAAGIAVRDGAEIAVEEINADGGINGRPIELIVEDDENDPAVCSNSANKVISRDKVVAVIGGWGSSCTLAIAPVTTREQVPLLVETSSSYKVTDPDEAGSEWVFRINPPTRMEIDQIGQFLPELGMERVFFLPVNNDWGRGSVEDFTPLLEDMGVEIVGAEFYEQTNENFSPMLTAVQNSGADTVIITSDAAQIALILQQMESLQMDDIQVLTTGGSNFPGKVAELAGESATEGTYFTVFYPGVYDPEMSSDPERAAAFNEKWNASHDPIEIGESARGYDAVYMLAEALRSIDGDITPSSVRDALEGASTTGIMYGEMKFEEWDGLINQNVAPVHLGQYVGGQIEFVG